MKYIITVPNARYGAGDSRLMLTMHATTLAHARRIWRGSKERHIYRLIK